MGDSTEDEVCKIEECPGTLIEQRNALSNLGSVTATEWQLWGDWSQCTASCGEGRRVRGRACSALDGQCLGDSTEDEVCKVEECPGIFLF